MQGFNDAAEHRVDDDLRVLLGEVDTRETSSTSSAFVMLPFVMNPIMAYG
jgi:hypothetical protein